MRITEEQLYQYMPIVEAQKMARYPSDEELPKHKFSKRFERKMQHLIKVQKRSPRMKKMIISAKRVAVFLLICSTLTFSCLMTVEAFRMKVIEIVTEVFEDLTHFSFLSPAEPLDEMGELTFTYLPEEMEQIEIEKDDDALVQRIYFENTEGRQLIIDQQSVNNDVGYDVILDTEGGSSSTIIVDGEEGVLVTKGDWSSIMWDDDQYVWLVVGELSPDELTKVADGISVKK